MLRLNAIPSLINLKVHYNYKSDIKNIFIMTYLCIIIILTIFIRLSLINITTTNIHYIMCIYILYIIDRKRLYIINLTLIILD